MEDNNDSLSILGSRSLARSENSLAIVDKLLLERTNRDSIKAEYFFNLGLSRPFDENAVAIKDFNKAIELSQTNYLYYVKRGEKKYYTDDFNGAVEDYTKAIELNPLGELFYKRAKINSYQFNKDIEAIKDYTQAINLSSNLRGSYYELGIVKANLKYYDEAISNFSKAVEYTTKPYPTDPDAWEPYYRRGLVKLIIQDYRGAIEDFDKTFDLSSKFYMPINETELALNDLGLAKYYIQDYEGAIESFTGAIWHGERYGAEYYHRKEPKSILPENSLVTSDFTQNIFPLRYKSHANSYYNRGIVKRLLNDDEGAESDFQRANKIQAMAKTSSTP